MAKSSENQQEPFSARYLNDFVEFTAGGIQKTRKRAMLFTLPAFSGMILHLLRCQGFGVANYSFTLGRLGSTVPSTFATLGFSRQQLSGYEDRS
jgi:hypothetical protein